MTKEKKVQSKLKPRSKAKAKAKANVLKRSDNINPITKLKLDKISKRTKKIIALAATAAVMSALVGHKVYNHNVVNEYYSDENARNNAQIATVVQKE